MRGNGKVRDYDCEHGPGKIIAVIGITRRGSLNTGVVDDLRPAGEARVKGPCNGDGSGGVRRQAQISDDHGCALSSTGAAWRGARNKSQRGRIVISQGDAVRGVWTEIG